MSTKRMDQESLLVRRLRSGDQEAFQVLVHSAVPKLIAVARRLLGEHGEAEDPVQEAMVLAWKSIDRFDERSSMTSWLHRITVKAALARIRSRRHGFNGSHDRRLNTEVVEPADSRLDPEAEIEQTELHELVWKAVGELLEDQRMVLVMRDIEGMQSISVAEKLRVSDSAVRQRLHRGRQALAERLWPELCGTGRLTCEGRIGLLLNSIDRSVEPETLIIVDDHLKGCATCCQIFGAFRQIIEAARHPGFGTTAIDVTDQVLTKVTIS